MANTVPFAAQFGINVANNFLVNTSTLSCNGLWANSLGINVNSTLATTNISSNNVFGNTLTNLNLIANLVSANVLTGNIATLKSLIANECFVNSTSGNTATFVSTTANQVLVNTISGNIGTFSGDLSLLNYSSTTALTFGNSTIYTQITSNGVWLADANGAARHVPSEVLLQSGTVSGTNNFFVNFANEVNSNNFISMKLILKYYITGVADTGDFSLIGYYSADGTTATTSGYLSTVVYVTDHETPYMDGMAGDNNTGINGTNILYQDDDASLNHCYHVEILFSDTLNRSSVKTAFSRGISFFDPSLGFGAARPMIVASCHSSSMNFKGYRVNLENGTFNPMNWALVGMRI